MTFKKQGVAHLFLCQGVAHLCFQDHFYFGQGVAHLLPFLPRVWLTFLKLTNDNQRRCRIFRRKHKNGSPLEECEVV